MEVENTALFIMDESVLVLSTCRWMAGGWRDDGNRVLGEGTDGIQCQMLSMLHEIRTWLSQFIWNTHTRCWPGGTQIFGLLLSRFYSFLCNSHLFSLGDELPQHAAFLIFPCTQLSALSLSLINSLSLVSLPSPSSMSTSHRSLCSALVLPVLKRSACVIRARPDPRSEVRGDGETKERWGGEKEMD